MTDQPHYYVSIVRDNGNVEKRMGPFKTERKAEKVKAGVEINLDHWRYQAMIDVDWDVVA